MAKAKTTEVETVAVELTVEGLMSMGYSQEDAQEIVGANSSTGGGLPFPTFKINYDLEISHLAKKGEFVGDIVKDGDGEITGLTNFGDKVTIVILASGCQYSRYNNTTNSADVSSNIFPLSGTKSAIDFKSGKKISELKKHDPDNKIKFQEIMLVLVSSDSQPEPKPYIMYSKGAFLYSLGVGRKTLPNRGNMMYELTFGLKMLKNGATKYFEVDADSFVAKPRSMEAIKAGVATIPGYIKQFNDWVDGVNNSSPAEAAPTEEVAEYDDEDEVSFA